MLQPDKKSSDSTTTISGGELISSDFLAVELLRGLEPSLASGIEFVPINPMRINELRDINSVLFPMAYQERYYKDVLAQDSLARLVYWKRTTIVATFSCRLQVFHEGQKPHMECYIMTFGVLAPYRRLKLGSVMLKSIIEYYRRRNKIISRLSLHVHTTNDAAIKFYLSHGFQIVDTVENYYKRLVPTTAHILRLNL